MSKRSSNMYMAAVLLRLRDLHGFCKGDPRISRRTRTMYAALVRGAYRGERKASNAFGRFCRSIRDDAINAGILNTIPILQPRRT
jgi:hypothetical protein